jgi:hypothetical protein
MGLLVNHGEEEQGRKQKGLSRGGEMGEYKELFKFAAKAGSLEGYLYQRGKIESLCNWVDNIADMYHKLPDSIKEDIKEEYAFVLRRILTNGEKVLQEDMSSKLKGMLSELERSL